ncbi:uncharacterized protein [Euwallacea similis]|uniref:uncharacterized protein n=1 Tax=Euwallacea similis TaxID=1736056 RepID=UPI00344CD29F
MNFSNLEKRNIVECYIRCNLNAVRAADQYFEQFFDRRQPALCTFRRLYDNLGPPGSYLKRIGRSETDACWFYGEPDDPEHTVFGCCRFAELRSELRRKCAREVSRETCGEFLLRFEENWNAIRRYFEKIMKIKITEEKEREKQGADAKTERGPGNRKRDV